MDIASRKDDHIKASIVRNVETGSTWFNELMIVTDSAPSINLKDISTDVELFGKKLSMPLIIGALTGGTDLGFKINRILARVAEKYRLGICCGSQRIAIERPETKYTFSIIREEAQTTLKIANIGAPQVSIVDEDKLVDTCNQAIDMIDADALAIHLNPLQECLQYEGEPQYRGFIDKLRRIVRGVNKPIIVKEVGFGISRRTVRKLKDVGISAIEVAGKGGTNFTIVEKYRVEKFLDSESLEIYESLKDIGIPTLLSLCEVIEEFNGIIIASGGIRSGTDIIKAIALGAHATSIARPFLEKALEGYERVCKYVKKILEEVKIVMFMTDCKDMSDVRNRLELIPTPRLLEILRIRRLEKCIQRMMKCTQGELMSVSRYADLTDYSLAGYLQVLTYV